MKLHRHLAPISEAQNSMIITDSNYRTSIGNNTGRGKDEQSFGAFPSPQPSVDKVAHTSRVMLNEGRQGM